MAPASWETTLAIELQELAEIELDFDLEVTGFETAELDLLIGGGAEDVEPDSADTLAGLDPNAPTVSRPGADGPVPSSGPRAQGARTASNASWSAAAVPSRSSRRVVIAGSTLSVMPQR